MTTARYTRVRGGTVTMEVEAEIDVCTVLEEVDEDALRVECEKRGIILTKQVEQTLAERRDDFEDLAAELRRAAAAGDRTHLEVLIIKLRHLAGLHPINPTLDLATGARSAH